MYNEEEFLQLSGIQHFVFCRRQWALIHIERQWQENTRTIEGAFLHEKAHSVFSEKRGDVITTGDMPVFSSELGICGACDVVEFNRDEDNGVPLRGRKGKFTPVPVEYKRGKPKEHDADLLQLCAQAMCIEDMLVCRVPKGYLFYGEPRRRTEVLFDEALRRRVCDITREMHEYFRRGYTPRVKPTKACKACSLSDICLPTLGRGLSAAEYMRARTEGEANE
jgi:CRISPR-associated exonuclease Cas4